MGAVRLWVGERGLCLMFRGDKVHVVFESVDCDAR